MSRVTDIKKLIDELEADETLSHIERAVALTSINNHIDKKRPAAQKAAVQQVYDLGYVMRRQKGTLDFNHAGVAYVLNSGYKQYSCDHIPLYKKKYDEAMGVKALAVESYKAIEEGLTLGPEAVPPAKARIVSPYVKIRNTKNGPVQNRRRVYEFRDAMPFDK